LPPDFRDKHPSVWVEIHSSLFHPAARIPRHRSRCAGVRECFPQDWNSRVRARPAGIEGEVRHELDQLLAGYAVVERALDVAGQLVRAVECNEARDGDQAAVTFGQRRGVPSVAEQRLVAEAASAGAMSP
jgi:hypothetical protein